MRPRTLIGLMFCTLFSLSTPAFAQTAQPVIQTAQAAQSDVTIPEGTTQEFDAAQGEIKFDGTLTNKGTIIITSSHPAQTEAVLRAVKLDNQGTIISRVPSLTIYTEKVYGAGEVTAPENIAIAAADKDLLIANGTYRAKYFRPSAERKLSINARRIDAQVDLKAYELSIGVREGNLDIVQQKVDGDPIYYNRGGDITAVMPGNGFDIYVLAAGNVNLSGVNAIGLNGEVRDFVVTAGLHFANGGGVDEGNSEFGCGGFGGVSCAQTIENNSGPGQIFEGAPGGPFEPSGTITINGAIARGISLSARDIVINGTLDARQDNTRPGSPSIILDAANSITVNAQLKTEATTDQLKEGFAALQAPTINVNSKITSDSVFIAAFENSVATTGSITTAAIEARTSYIYINAGHIQFEEVGGALLPSALPHDSGEFTIKTGKLTAHRYVMLSATGNIDAGNIELLPNEAPVPLGTHDVRIHANVGKEDAPPLKIGGGANGAASITVQGTTDLGEGLTQKTGVIFLTNGPSGDIVLDGAKIHVTNEHNGTPSLIAYAGTGQVTVKGNIVFDGTATAPAGQILLVGDEIRSTGATISVKDTLADAVEKPAKVVLATSKITLAGDLTIEANSKAQTSIRVVPKGSITLDPQEHFEGLYHYVDKFPVNVTENEVLVNGSGNLTVKSKSDGAKVEITANPLRFNNGTSTVTAQGEESSIAVDYAGSGAQNTLIFSGSTATFDASNTDGNAGSINIQATRIRSDVGADPKFLATLSNGDGGSSSISAERINLAETSNKFDVSSTTAKSGNLNVLASGRLDLGSIEANANSGGAEPGGEIHLVGGNNAGTLGSETATVKLSARNIGGTGNGGTIEIAHLGTLRADAGTATNITVAAGTNGNGGIINFHDIGTITLIGSLRADGAGTGEAGSITLEQTSTNTMTLTNATISANGACDVNNDCGVININSQGKIAIEGASVLANGISDSKAGRINIIGNSGIIDLTATDVSASSSLAGNGEGGFVNVSSNFQIIVDQAKLNADGHGNGRGGQVRVTTGTSQPLSVSNPDTRISAKGGSNGEGGIVVIPSITKLGESPTNLFYVNTFIQAAAGSNVISTSSFGGSVSLNGVTCQKTFTGLGWPSAYWNCVNPGNASSTEGLPAQAAQQLIQGAYVGQLADNGAYAYVFMDNAHLSSFFHSAIPDPVSGLTFDEGLTVPKIAINVGVLESNTDSGTHNTTQLTEISAHEHAHAIDFSGGIGAVTSGSNAYGNKVQADLNFLDAAGQPCQAGGTGPFNGVIDFQTNAQFCSNGGTGNVLNNPNGIYSGKTNSQIASISQPGTLASNKELYAQAYAYQSYVQSLPNVSPLRLTSVANQLFQKGYYQCAQALAAQAAGTAFVPQYACP